MSTTGFTFTEAMSGFVHLGSIDPKEGASKGKSERMAFVMNVTISIEDLDAFVKDPKHQGSLSGTIDYTPFGLKIPISNGVFNLFSPSEDPEMKYMVYEFNFTHNGKQYFFSGKKEVKDDPGFDLWADTTTLYSRFYEGGDETGSVAGAGVLNISLGEFMGMLATMRPLNSEGVGEAAAAYAKFGALFLGELWNTYAKFATKD